MRKTLDVQKLKRVATNIRRHIVVMSGNANVSHSGSALSTVEILTALYFEVMRVNPKKPNWEGRDRFILSKGHGGAALYATLAERGVFSVSRLTQFCMDGSTFTTHPVKDCVRGVEATTGSLGHGLSMGIGMALAGRHDKKSYRVYVMLSDGECDEGSTWEGILYAGFHKLDNMVVFVDYNKIQSFGRTKEVLDLEPIADKLKAFRWCVREIDGHNFKEILRSASHAIKHKGKPHAFIAHTIKGKGISYMEDKLEWHYRAPTGDLMRQALDELSDTTT